MKSCLIGICLVLASLHAQSLANPKPEDVDAHVHRSGLQPFSSLPLRPNALTASTYQQAIDHFGQLPGKTFSQRYWFDSEYATNPQAAPVIFHMCGEGDCSQGYFQSDSALTWAQQLGANIVYLEHRYYGASLPFEDISTEHLQFLTIDNVLEDLADFQQWWSSQQNWTGAWVAVGGSYSGTVAALYRQKHPELVVGALASSAPMISGVGAMQGSQDDVDSMSSTDPADSGGGRQWTFQSCTSLGYWQANGPSFADSVYLPSTWLCQKLFGNSSLVNTSLYNQKYDQPFLSAAANAPSHILFTYGGNDVWTNLGLSQQKNANPQITIHLIPDAGHHFDLNAADTSDSSAVVSARNAFVTLAKQWLGLTK